MYIDSIITIDQMKHGDWEKTSVLGIVKMTSKAIGLITIMQRQHLKAAGHHNK